MGNVNTLNSCCKTCSDCPNCYDLSIYKIQDLLYTIDCKIADFSYHNTFEGMFGFKRRNKSEDNWKKLLLYRDTVQSYYNSIRQGYDHCLCPEEMGALIEGITGLTGKILDSEGQGQITDSSQLNEWVASNPGCVAYHDWEKALYQVCPVFGITVFSDDSCKLLYNIVNEYNNESYKMLAYNQAKEIANKTGAKFNKSPDDFRFDPFKVYYALSVYKQACNLKLTPKATKLEDCKLSYDLLVSEYVCDLTFDTYLKLIDCRVSPTIINELTKCGVVLNVGNSGEVILQMADNTSYKLSGLSIDLTSNEVDCTILSNILATDICNLSSNAAATEYLDCLEESYVNLT